MSKILKKYELTENLNENDMCKIIKGKNKITDEEVVIKITPKKCVNLLKNEAIIYNYIKKIVGFPSLKYYCSDNENNYLVLSLLNKNLFELKKMYSTLSLKSVLQIGIQMLERVKFLHSLKIIHRDIKPHNFMIGFCDKINIIHIIDFGFCKKFIDENGNHILIKKDKGLIGTPDFVSVNVMYGFEPSRRDDIESLIYVMVFLYIEEKTWKRVNVGDKIFNIQNLYENIYIPKIFIDLLNYTHKLQFSEKPNYDFLIYSIQTFFGNVNLVPDNLFEWS